jgi:hypothetical protein
MSINRLTRDDNSHESTKGVETLLDKNAVDSGVYTVSQSSSFCPFYEELIFVTVSSRQFVCNKNNRFKNFIKKCITGLYLAIKNH